MAENTREIVLGILEDINENDTMSHTAIHRALNRCQYLPKRDRSFITRLAEGTIERAIELDYVINQYASVKTDKMKPVIRDIIRSAVYQILYMDTVPDAAAVDEAVRLTQRRGFYNLKGFVNGVLRSIIRGKNDLPYPDEGRYPVRYLSVAYSMPEWIVREWISEFGMFVTKRMLESFLLPRPTVVRYSTDRIQAKTITESLRNQGVTVKRAPYLPYAYIISDYNYLPALQAFQKGWIFPQDVSSMLVAECAAPKKTDYIIDVCAAPGGKTLHLADRMENFGMIEARDLTEKKVDLIRENVRRCDRINVRPMVCDALIPDPDSEMKADIVICDLPCSGLGVIGRKPDIKYRASMEKISSLQEMQRAMLKNAASFVKPGGVLMYSTCTIGHRENQDNVRWFLENFPFESESLNRYLPEQLRRLSTEQGYLQLMPGIHDTDGFFIARFRKKGGV